MRATVVLLAIVGVAAGGAAYYKNFWSAEPANSFRTTAVTQGDLTSTISATGTIEPEELVDVGAQVSGRIDSFGRDPHDPSKPVDYNTAVDVDTVLARIDPTFYEAQVNQAVASLLHAKADLLELEAKCAQTEKEWKRAESLRPSKAIADTDYDLAKANFLVAKAFVEVGKATIQQAEATLAMAKINFGYTVIKSPIKGMIIKRRVNIGQTVVAAMNTASMFLIAKDLHHMQVWASVNETDIGRISEGMPVRFTVNTYPDRTFKGKVIQIRLNAVSTQNIVTYTVVVGADNPDLKLLPYMTANLRFQVEKHSSVFQVPNAAIRWKPRPDQTAPNWRQASASLSDRDAEAGGKEPKQAAGSVPQAKPQNGKDAAPKQSVPKKKPSDSGHDSKSEKSKVRKDRVWVEEGGFARPIEVQIGLTDGTMTEIAGSDVKAGMKVIVGEASKDDRAGGDIKNPMIPQFPGKRR